MCSSDLAGDDVAVFVIIGTLAALFAAYIAVRMLVMMLSGMLRCVGSGLLGASDDESQHVRREPTLCMDGLTVGRREATSISGASH